MKHKTLYDSPKYKTFINDRNKALERMEANAQLDISRITYQALENITGYVSHMALARDLSFPMIKHLSSELDKYLSQQFEGVATLIQNRTLRLRKTSFVLSYLAELEAIARATGRTTQLSVNEFKIAIEEQQKKDTVSGRTLQGALFIEFTKFQNKIILAFQRALISDSTPLELVNAVKKTFPKMSFYKRPPKKLKTLREANKNNPWDNDDASEPDKKEFEFYHNLTNDDDWTLAVDAYKDTELPASRFDNQAIFDPDDGVMKYNWEIEQEVTDDFVQQVRDGSIQAANDLGIKDGVWVAVVDKKTCEACCLPRAGKLISEIETMLRSGELDKEVCDATSPPAHPFCRCDIAFVASTDPVEGPDWKSFDEWLNS